MSTNSVNFKKLVIKNIPSDTTPKDLSEILGFSTPFLKRNSVIEVKQLDDGETYAVVILPEVVHKEALRLNGVEYYDQNLIVEDATDNNENATPSTTHTIEVSDDNTDDIRYMLLDCRNFPDLNFPPVQEYEVCDALMLDHADDAFKAVRKFWGRNLGTYGIESKDMARYLEKSLTIRGHEIKLIAVRNQPIGHGNGRDDHQQHPSRRPFFDPDGVKIRIFDAFGLQNRSIHAEQFDNYFADLGVEIIKMTQPERCRERRHVFNTNRFIVVKSMNADGTKVDFGESINVSDVTFRISYFGMKKYCGRCDSRHGHHCPSKMRFDLMQEQRKDKVQKAKIYSDSTLRYVNQVALSTDVACMTGGGIGQICNVIPFDTKHDEVIINGGTNELKCDNLQEFVYTIDKAVEKLAKLATDVKVTVVIPPIPTAIPEDIVKGKYLKETISNVDSVKVIPLQDIEQDATQFHKHPTKKGTLDMVLTIHAENNNAIIMQDCQDDVIHPRKYRGVQTLFKTGCRGCDDLGYNPYLCSACRERAKIVDISKLEEDISKLKDELFPLMDHDVDMRENNASKRLHNDSEDDVEKKAAKTVKGSS